MAKKKAKKAAKKKVAKKPQPKPQPKPQADPPKPEGILGTGELIPASLYERARKAGVSEAQMKSLGTVANIFNYCNQISPKTNPDAMPKKGETVKGPATPVPETMPATMAVHKDTLGDEKGIIESVVRKLNIKFKNPPLNTITKTIVFDCKKKQIVSAEYAIE
jgi:hypothetical protein